jgi:hypothetical protein
MGYHRTSTQLVEKVMSTIERFHLDVDAADLSKGMGVGAGARRDTEGGAQFLRSPVYVGLRPAIEDLNNVNLSGDALDRFLAEVAPAGVVRVFEVDQSALLSDGVDRLLWRQVGGNRLLEEEADQFAFSREDLLADDGCLARLEERLGAGNAFMVREEDGGETQLAAAAGHLEWRYPAVKRRGAVKVEINPNSGAPCASHHVRYYRPGEAQGRV